MAGPPIHELVTAAIRYWEPRRIVYNVVVVAVVVIYYAMAPPGPQHVVTANSILLIFSWFVLANVAYCAAHVAEIYAQASNFGARWMSVRWIVFVVGTALAAVLSRFFSLWMFGRA